MKELIFMVCIGDSWQKSGRIAIEINRMYAEKNGYDFAVVDKTMDASKTPHWTKLLAMRQFIMSRKYDSVFYIDADAIFTDFGRRLEQVPNPNGLPVTICSENKNLSDRRGENTGTMLFKSCGESVELLDFSLSLYPECEHSCVFEQEGVGLALERRFSAIWNKLPCREMNSYFGRFALGLNKPHDLWRPGDFVMHMLREREEYKNNVFSHFLAVAKNN